MTNKILSTVFAILVGSFLMAVVFSELDRTPDRLIALTFIIIAISGGIIKSWKQTN